MVLRGAGTQAFSTGADIAEFDTERATAEGSRAYEAENVRAFDAVAGSAKPVIAAIHGFCFGAGVGLAAACDLRIAADDARFSVPAARLGVGYPPTALRSLVALAGPETVKRLFFLAGQIDAAQALAAGLVGEVAPKEELEARVAAAATAIAAGAPMTILAASAPSTRRRGSRRSPPTRCRPSPTPASRATTMPKAAPPSATSASRCSQVVEAGAGEGTETAKLTLGSELRLCGGAGSEFPLARPCRDCP